VRKRERKREFIATQSFRGKVLKALFQQGSRENGRPPITKSPLKIGKRREGPPHPNYHPGTHFLKGEKKKRRLLGGGLCLPSREKRRGHILKKMRRTNYLLSGDKRGGPFRPDCIEGQEKGGGKSVSIGLAGQEGVPYRWSLERHVSV